MVQEKSILFLTRSLGRGGAERQLALLAKGLAKKGFVVGVIVFYGENRCEKELVSEGVCLIDLDKKGRWDVFPFLYRLVKHVRKQEPTVLHSYMGVSNILAACLKALLPKTNIVWGVRSSNVKLAHYDRFLRWVYKVECNLARFSDHIIANSNAGKEYAVKNNFPREKISVIPNGIDTDYFAFSNIGRKKVRGELGFSDHELVIGLVARVDPMKGHAIFLHVAKILLDSEPELNFICVGDGELRYKNELIHLADKLKISKKIHWMGARDDMPNVYSSLDIFCSSSVYGEGFSNSIAEAMACGVPVVTTDVGDASLIVGDTGSVVKPNDASVLASEIKNLVNMERKERHILGMNCSSRIVSEFSVEKLIERTEKTLFSAR